jgi:hypothetical protein
MTDNVDNKTKELTTTNAKPIRERRISKRVAEVVRLIVVGECKTTKAAAERAGMNYTHVCETLKKPHVRVFIDRRVRETIANGTMRATARLIELMDSASDHVSLDAVKHELALNGHQPPSGPAANVNISVMQAGYVIDCRSDAEIAAQARVVDLTPISRPREPSR